MNFDNQQLIANSGFEGFISIADLQKTQYQQIPNEKGVYLILRLTEQPPQFLQNSIGGHFKGKDPTVPIAELQANWVSNTIVVYIGKAGSLEGEATLRSRLKQYFEYGQGKPIGHQGGRYIWQLADSANLIVCWKPTTDENPAAIETALIQEFTAKYGKRPFANLRD